MNVVKLVYALMIAFSMIATGGCNVAVDQEANARLMTAAATSGGLFGGVWNVTLIPRKDTCKLGLTDPVPVTVSIVQNGKKATIVIEGFPQYKAKVKGKKLIGGGKYSSSGFNVKGKILARSALKGQQLKVKKAKFTLKSSGKSCSMLFKGNGDRD
ncbi:hypothetical protein OAO01_06830 [Oligoflexia bacterium]|nr:hypothetical protein [Oligoflexia bacterium]